ncbi:MAG: hypothetical protein R3Y32_01295 [Bacillota bacterium]
MRNIFSYFKGINKIKNQQDLSEVLEKVTAVVDDKMVQIQEESKQKELDPVIIKDENGDFIDCCRIVKSDSPQNYFEIASAVLNGLSDVEKNVRFKFNKFMTIFYTALMFAYTVFNISHINDLANYTIMNIFIALFCVFFIAITVVNIAIYKNTHRDLSPTSRQIKILKNYKSVAVALRRIMLLWSLGITIYSMIITWEHGPAYQALNILMLSITSCILLYIIYRGIRKIQRRSATSEDGKTKIFFSTVRDVFKNSKTADIISFDNNKSAENASPLSITSNKPSQDIKTKNTTAKRMVKKHNSEIKRAYKQQYKNDLKKLKEKYLENIDKI